LKLFPERLILLQKKFKEEKEEKEEKKENFKVKTEIDMFMNVYVKNKEFYLV